MAEAQRLGFLGPGDIERQISHSRAMASAVESALRGHGQPLDHGIRLLDLGSGNGLPGLIFGLDWAHVDLWLLEASGRRAGFLSRALVLLALDRRGHVVHARAEEAGHGPLRGTMDVVAARSFGSPGVTAECGAPFLRVGGLLAISEPPAGRPGEGGDRWPPAELRQLGLVKVADPTPPVQLLRLVEPCPERFPRRTGVPGKRPLF